LTFTDVNEDIWECECQVIKWIELSDFWNQKRVWISVELITNSSEFKNSDTQFYNEWRNTRFWKNLLEPVWFGIEYQYYRDIIDYQWVIDSPLSIQIQITAENPAPNNKINITHEYEWDWEALQIDNVDSLELEIWDMIILNTDERKAILIKPTWFTDITWLITLWSQRPLLKLWENIMAIDTWASEKTMNITYEWNEVF
jgi:hypothetical protein